MGARPTNIANPSNKRNESPQGLNVPRMSTASELDFGEFGQDFLDTTGGNSSVHLPLLWPQVNAGRRGKRRIGLLNGLSVSVKNDT